MRPLYEELDGFDFDDTLDVKRSMREQRREAERLARRRAGRGRSSMKLFADPDDDVDSDFIEVYEDYNEDEFDSYSDISIDH